MKRWAALMIVTAALGAAAQAALAERPRHSHAPRILEPSFAQSEPRHFQKYMQAHPRPFRPPARFATRIVAVPVLVPLYLGPYPDYGAAPETAPPVYAPGATPYWYFCPDSQRYYPDVGVCASSWLAFF